MKAIEHVARLAQDKSLEPVFHDFELNPLVAVPADQVSSEEFRTHRWPQILELIEARRRAYAQRQRRAKTAKKRR